MTKHLKSILVIMFLTLATAAVASEELSSFGGEITWSGIRTELEKEAVGLAVKASPRLNEATYVVEKRGAGYLGPAFDLKTGGDDSFESVVAKVIGFWQFAPPLDDDGEPDYIHYWVHVFPFAAGIEGDVQFETPAALAELGWTPIGPRKRIDPDNPSLRFGLDPLRSFGFFLQSGYKFDNTKATTNTSGLTIDGGGLNNDSEENPDEAIARLKAELAYGFNLGNRVSLMPKGVVWYDILNSEVYYKAEARIRIALVADKYSLDFGYEKGSGAPNFNEGDQFSSGLTVAF